MSTFQTEDNVAVQLTFRRLFGKLWPYFWRHRRSVIVSLLIVSAFVVVGRTLPFIFGAAVDHGLKKHNLHLIGWLAVAYLGVEIIRAGLSYLQTAYIQKFGNRVLFEIRERLIRHVQNLPLTYFDKNPSGRTVTRVTNDVFALGELFSNGFSQIFVALFELASIFVSLALLSWKLTAVCMLIVPILLAICFWISRKIRFQFGAAKRKLSAINAYSAEAISGMKVLQLFDRQQEARGAFGGLSVDYRNLQLGTIQLFATLWPVVEGFNLFTLATALLMSAIMAPSLHMTIGETSAFLLLLQSFFKPLKAILERYNQLQNSLASADRVFQTLDEIPESGDGRPLTQKLRGEIEIKDLSFAYGQERDDVLTEINAHIPAGSSTALVGRTGSGKTTMISLIQRLYAGHRGEIRIDGQDIHQWNLRDYRSHIGVIQQDGFIFSGTFLSNITMNHPKIPRDRAVWAARQAQALDVIERHGGFDAVIQERGSNLSVGERQLIAFARVLAFDPDILILDEATANIDSINEEHIQTALKNVIQGRTSLIIAHRLSTVVACDQILVLDQGQLVQAGSHPELLRQPGIYQHLYRSHFQNAAGHGTAKTDKIPVKTI